MKMTITSIWAVLAFLFLPVSGALAGDAKISGSVTLGGLATEVDGDEAKAGEYTDPNRHVFGGVNLKYDSSKYYLRFDAGETLRDDEQKHLIDLEGGLWGKFRYNLFYNYIPYNSTFDAKTFYAHVGDSRLKAKYDPDVPSSWSDFDYQTERKSFGGGLSLDLLKPYFLNFSAQSEKKQGIKPTSFGDLSGPNGTLIELPEPVDYKTDTFRVEGGYSKKPYYIALSYEVSRFSNDDDSLRFYDVVFPRPYSVTLPVDNNYYKASVKGAVVLPYNSKLYVNAATAHAESESDGNNLLVLDDFTGKVDTNNVDVVLTSSPVSSVDAKVFYSYNDRDNKSRGDDDHLDWTTNRFGGQVGMRLPEHVRMTLGYSNSQTDYANRFDAKDKTDDLYSAGLAWSGLHFATVKIGYEKRVRDSNRNHTDAKEENDAIWRYDVAPSDRDTFKASVDLFPMDNLSASIGYKHKDTQYKHDKLSGASTGLGLREEEGDQFFADASYDFRKLAMFYGYFDYEWMDSTQYGFSSDEPTNWKFKQKDNTYDYGIGADFFIVSKVLTLKTRYDYVRSDGSGDYTYLNMATPRGADLNDWGEYRKESFSIRAIYDITKNIGLMAGYAYEHLSTDDDQLNGYEYLPATNVYLTGAYEDPSYTANVFFMSASYKF